MTPALEAAATVSVAMDHGPFQLAAACDGICQIGLTPLAGERALALWNAPEGSWAQRFDLALGSSVGPPLAIGKMTKQSELPHVFGLPNGDTAVLGVLPDGRVTFARGSEVGERRVAPKIIVASGARGVDSLAVTETAEGLVLLILRKGDPEDERAERSEIDAELHWLDARGEEVRRPWVSRTLFAVEARLAACRGQLYLAWNSLDGVLVTRMSSDGGAREQTLFPEPAPDVSARPGPLLCSPAGAKLVTGWQDSNAFELQKKVSVASISATEPLPERGSWAMTLPLPGVPGVRFASQVTPAGVNLLVNQDLTATFVALDLTAGKVNRLPDSVKVPAATACVASSDGHRALCLDSKISPRIPECRASVTHLEAAFVGEAPPSSPSSILAPAAPYFAAGTSPIPDPLAPSKRAVAERRSQLWCGEPGWSGLVKAVESYCVELRRKRDAATKKAKRKELDDMLSGYCDPKPYSVLFQATHCTDEPLTCEHDAVSDVLSVDRAEFEGGSDWLSMDIFDKQCQVWFSGKGDTWQLIDHECNGD